MKIRTQLLLWGTAVMILAACSSQSGRRETASPGKENPAQEEVLSGQESSPDTPIQKDQSGVGQAGQSAADQQEAGTFRGSVGHVSAGDSRPGSGTSGTFGAQASTPASALRKVTFYLENSQSMFGYVSGITRYVDVVAELAEKPDFVKEDIPREFFFINGTGPVITPIGDDPVLLKKKLNTAGFRCGDITRSNLNSMFQTALSNAGGGAISILISDGIYDIGDGGMTSLVTSGKETRSQFIRRLQTADLQTLMIKLTSEFKGDYFYASRKGKMTLNSERPYYIWIFGESHLLARYFPDSYIASELSGYETLARFLKPSGESLPWQLVSENCLGSFRFDHKVKNRLVDAKPDRNGRGFQVTLAVDFSSLPFPGEVYLDPESYNCSGNYAVAEVKVPERKIHALPFTPTHLVSVKSLKNPAGKVTVALVNRVPGWIAATAAADEENMAGDTSRTFGLNYLTDAITEAYRSVAGNQPLAAFAFEVQ